MKINLETNKGTDIWLVKFSGVRLRSSQQISHHFLIHNGLQLLELNDFLVRIIWLFLKNNMGAFYPFDLIPLATFTHQLADLKYYLLNSPLADVIVSSDQINMPLSLVKNIKFIFQYFPFLLLLTLYIIIFIC